MRNSIKKIALSLLVACLAIGFQSFTNVKSKGKVFAIKYYQTTEGNYSSTQPVPTPNLCQIGSMNPCIITFERDVPQVEFTVDELPALLEEYGGEASTNLNRSVL